MGCGVSFKKLLFGRKCKDKKCYTKSVFFHVYLSVASAFFGLALAFLGVYLKQGYLCFNCEEALKESLARALF